MRPCRAPTPWPRPRSWPARSSRTRATPTSASSSSSNSSRFSRTSVGVIAHMAVSTWVFAEAADGKVASITLELLTKARQLGGTVEAFYGGADVDAVAEHLGTFGATKVY